VLDGGQPRLLPSGMPDNRLILFPAAQVRIIDTWDVAGLRGTGSHDIAVEDRFVPAARSLSLITDRPRATGPLYAFPVFGLLALGIAGVALGIARRALDELVALAGGKTPSGSRRLLAERPVIQAEVARAEATLTQAQAELAMAELQLAYTEVRAPVDGVISKRTVEIGQVVQPGQPLLAIVPLHEVWVLANFKETQLGRVRPGMRADVEIDGFPDKVFHGTVESISAGTGARFSLLPPENATGNWVKVVQRVPVKILLEHKEVGNPQPLRAGMSAAVTIRLR
jgi:multidrug efflux pump subunit AcrA (membrane-fusion protein)